MRVLLAGATLAAVLTSCDLPAPDTCEAAIGLAFIDQPPTVRSHMQRIAWRESRNTPTARNGQHIGCVQIASRTHAARLKRMGFTAADLLRPWVNALVARALWNESGFQPWQATA